MADLEAQIRLSIDRSKLLAPLNEAEQKAKRIGGALVPTSVNYGATGAGGTATGGGQNAQRYFSLQLSLLAQQVRLQNRMYGAIVDVRKEVTRVLVAVGATAAKRAAQDAADKTQAKGEQRAAGARSGESFGTRVGAGIDAGAAAGAAAIGGIFKLVAAANPYVVEKFDRALLDLQAIIGRELIPTVNSWTAGVRRLADDLAVMDPAQKKMIRNFGETAGVMALTAVALGTLRVALSLIQRHPVIALLTAVAGVAYYQHLKNQDELAATGGKAGGGAVGGTEPAGMGRDEAVKRVEELDSLVKTRRNQAGEGEWGGGVKRALLDTFAKIPGLKHLVGGKTIEELDVEITRKRGELATAAAERSVGKRGTARGAEGTPERAEYDRQVAEERGRFLDSLAARAGAGRSIAGRIGNAVSRAAAGAIGGGVGAPIAANNAGASLGAAYNQTAGVSASIDSAFVELTDKFLKLGSAAGEPEDAARQAAIDISKILPEIARKLGNLAPGDGGGPAMRPGP